MSPSSDIIYEEDVNAPGVYIEQMNFSVEKKIQGELTSYAGLHVSLICARQNA
jgi:hypothetical protein